VTIARHLQVRGQAMTGRQLAALAISNRLVENAPEKYG